MIRRIRHLLEYGLILLVRLYDRILGARLAGEVAVELGRMAYRPLGIRADVVEDQLGRAFPDRDDDWVRSTASAAYAHLAREGLSLLRLSRLGREQVLAVTDVGPQLEELQAAVGAGSGAIVATGHLGNWELAGAALAARGIPLDVVAQRQSNPYFDQLINRTRERLGMRVIPRGRATSAALAALAEGRVVGLVADQDARSRGVFVPFMGRPASTHRGAAVLSLRSGAPLFMGVMVRRPGGTYEGRIRRMPAPPDGDFEERVRTLTAAFNAALESVVREFPEQYFWHHRRWKTAPPEITPAVGGSRNGPGAEAV
jgi:Kdo2-lipid IVA lauroyltransferase/acyltransferase